MHSIDKIGVTITAIYESAVDVETRKAVIDALFIQRNDVALVALARKEKDLEFKKTIVQRLSAMKSKSCSTTSWNTEQVGIENGELRFGIEKEQ
jgi:hypothetical protein